MPGQPAPQPAHGAAGVAAPFKPLHGGHHGHPGHPPRASTFDGRGPKGWVIAGAWPCGGHLGGRRAAPRRATSILPLPIFWRRAGGGTTLWSAAAAAVPPEVVSHLASWLLRRLPRPISHRNPSVCVNHFQLGSSLGAGSPASCLVHRIAQNVRKMRTCPILSENSWVAGRGTTFATSHGSHPQIHLTPE